MQNYVVTKNFRFEAAHRLGEGYEGKCTNVHGHSWNGRLALKASQLDRFAMSIDFGVMGEFCKKVEAMFDHTLIVSETDTDLILLCHEKKWACVVTAGNPTCEKLAQLIYNMAAEQFGEVNVHEVVINETCTTSCTYTR